jgi:hypothetical protein
MSENPRRDLWAAIDAWDGRHPSLSSKSALPGSPLFVDVAAYVTRADPNMRDVLDPLVAAIVEEERRQVLDGTWR